MIRPASARLGASRSPRRPVLQCPPTRTGGSIARDLPARIGSRLRGSEWRPGPRSSDRYKSRRHQARVNYEGVAAVTTACKVVVAPAVAAVNDAHGDGFGCADAAGRGRCARRAGRSGPSDFYPDVRPVTVFYDEDVAPSPRLPDVSGRRILLGRAEFAFAEFGPARPGHPLRPRRRRCGARLSGNHHPARRGRWHAFSDRTRDWFLCSGSRSTSPSSACLSGTIMRSSRCRCTTRRLATLPRPACSTA